MKFKKQLEQAFGVDDYGFIAFPYKMSNVQVARVMYGNQRGCSWCFPHGWETSQFNY